MNSDGIINSIIKPFVVEQPYEVPEEFYMSSSSNTNQRISNLIGGKMNITNKYLGHLKPCPKCNGNNIDFWFSTEMNYARSYYITCNECRYSTGECSDKQQAIDRWNERNKNLT